MPLRIPTRSSTGMNAFTRAPHPTPSLRPSFFVCLLVFVCYLWCAGVSTGINGPPHLPYSFVDCICVCSFCVCAGATTDTSPPHPPPALFVYFLVLVLFCLCFVVVFLVHYLNAPPPCVLFYLLVLCSVILFCCRCVFVMYYTGAAVCEGCGGEEPVLDVPRHGLHPRHHPARIYQHALFRSQGEHRTP